MTNDEVRARALDDFRAAAQRRAARMVGGLVAMIREASSSLEAIRWATDRLDGDDPLPEAKDLRPAEEGDVST